MQIHDRLGAKARLTARLGEVTYYRLSRLEEMGAASLQRLPFSQRVLLENLLRRCDGTTVTEDDVLAAARWGDETAAPTPNPNYEIAFMPARVVLQDFTGVPCVVDLAAMRSVVHRLGGDPKSINPIVPVDLVIDHSVQVDAFGSALAFSQNVQLEFERNGERYALLRWAQKAFQNFRVVPPGTGIVHQVNLEYLANVVQTRRQDGETVACPDTLVGTDSHTTMINGLGVLGWGVGGIEAEAVMLGQPYYMVIPEVVGFRLAGELPEGATATDLVLTVTNMLRKKGVVGKFVEFFGPGLKRLSLPDRATISNMAPEYGATVGFFPVDAETLAYLRGTGRSDELVDLVERYTKAQGLFYAENAPDPIYSDVLELDLSALEPSLAGPRRPHDLVRLRDMKEQFWQALETMLPPSQQPAPQSAIRNPQSEVWVPLDGLQVALGHGSVAIAAITSCTNTSNPSVMVGAGLLARNAVKRGLSVKPHIKTSLAPGSPVVVDYLENAGLLPYLEALRFHVVGFGCTTCIGNSGPLPEPVAKAIADKNLVAAAVLSGNRNFEARIHALVRANYLASPMLVVAYALAGRIDLDLLREPLGTDPGGAPVYLRDIWPSQEEIRAAVGRALKPDMFRERYGRVFEGDERWKTLPVPEGDLYEWEAESTYIQQPPFFVGLTPEPPAVQDVKGARALVMVGDSITTDHVSPAGSIAPTAPAGRFLIEHGVERKDFNSYGSRRGNHEVMMRGTFANVRLKNLLVPGVEGGFTVHFPTGEQMTIYEAALRYKEAGVPLLVIAGKEYGSGSSRDWAAKGPFLLGVKAALAESYERIHRSNLIGMGVIPLQFKEGQNRETLRLTGTEVFDIEGLADGLRPRQEVAVRARRADGSAITFTALARLDTPVEIEYYRNGGILQTVLRSLFSASPR